jgi:hypothetical protein
MDYGVRLAKDLNRPASLVGIEKMPISVMPITGTIDAGLMTQDMLTMGNVIDVAEPQLEHLKIKAKEIWEQTTSDLEIGFPESKLEEITEDENPYLVIVEGHHELDTLNEWFGTYETRMAENLESPVLVVPKKTTSQPVQNILYMMDMNDHAVENMRILSQIATATDAHITVAVINSENDEVMESNPKYLRMVKTFRQFLGYDKMTYMQVFSNDAADSIKNLVKDKNADWLAFQHKDKSFFSRIFDDYSTEHLILQSKIPVLVF